MTLSGSHTSNYIDTQEEWTGKRDGGERDKQTNMSETDISEADSNK